MEENDIFSLSVLPTTTSSSPSLREREVSPLPFKSDNKPGIFKRLIAFFMRPFSVTRKTTSSDLANGFLGTAQAKLPLAFKGKASVAIATPMGMYAGKPTYDQRRLAEQQFQRMESSQGATIN